MTTTTKIAGEAAMTNQQIEQIAREHGTGGWQSLEDMKRFARALLASKPAVPEGWKPELLYGPSQNVCWTQDMVPRGERIDAVVISHADYERLLAATTAPAQSCGDAEQADAPQAVTTDDMEKAVRNSKWGKDIQSRNAFREGWKTALTALPLASEQADEAVTRDAERYRWMRDFNVRCKDGVDVKPPCEHVFASIYSHAVGTIPATRLVTGDELDRAIDAARAKDSK